MGVQHGNAINMEEKTAHKRKTKSRREAPRTYDPNKETGGCVHAQLKTLPGSKGSETPQPGKQIGCYGK